MLKQAPPTSAFTFRYSGSPHAVILPIGIAKPSQPPGGSGITRCDAVWDTGASGSCITPTVASSLALPATGQKTITGVGGQQVVNTYIVDVFLGSVQFPTIQVSETPIDHSWGMLLGMDILRQGDLALTSDGGNLVVSFQTPPRTTIDFFQELENSKLSEMSKGCRAVMRGPLGQEKKDIPKHLVSKYIEKGWSIARIDCPKGRSLVFGT